ncbi:MAG: hypothetical protein ACRENP_28235, partial [Longimicrobiales bacterium]
MKRNLVLGAALIITIGALGLGQAALNAAADQQAVQAPMFEVDPLWPKPLPNNWVLGMTIGVGVDNRDHVFIVHRGETVDPQTDGGASTDPPISECCKPAPPVLEFDPEGNLVRAWGGPGEGYD